MKVKNVVLMEQYHGIGSYRGWWFTYRGIGSYRSCNQLVPLLVATAARTAVATDY